MIKLFNWGIAAVSSVVLFLGLLTAALIYAPQTPLPDALNPTKPFNATEPLGYWSQYKLARALDDPLQCTQILSDLGLGFSALPDKEETPTCHIKSRVRLRSVAGAAIAPVETRCETAVRLALWGRHVVQPAAVQHLKKSVTAMTHYSSYSCRPIRNSSGATTRMSEHATANAIDIAAFKLSDGRRITLKGDWDGDPAHAAFLRDVRDGACDWFNTVLSPDYNALHADHFHFDQGRWNACR